MSSPHTVTGLIWNAAARNPHAVAVDDGVRSLSYHDLCVAADDVAEKLRNSELGGPEQILAIQMAPSVERIVTILGVLRARSAIMMLEPREPADRRSLLLDDSGAQALITDAGVEPLPATGSRAGRDGSDPRPERDAAYIAYTSGSTGRPKGVVTEHSAIVNYVRHVTAFCALGPGDAQPQLASIAFDMAVHEIFSTLSAGARLVVPRGSLINEPEAFFAACERHAITVLSLPTAVWHELGAGLRRKPDVRIPARLRLVFIGGEAAGEHGRDAWFAAASPELRVVNAYGPTEAAVAVTMTDLRANAPITLGRAITGVSLSAIDATGQKVGADQVGELVIGGAAPARGYIGDPKMTSERFPMLHGERVYRTGDLGSVATDGTVTFFGRIDRQLKINGGFRVEPQEVQAALIEAADFADAHVDVIKGASNATLVAFCVTPGPLDPGDLRARLLERLPAYMVPSRFVALDAMPLTDRGKVDRDVLLRLSDAGAAEATGDGTRDRVRAIWASVLGEAPAQDDDTFFEEGGDSLGAVSMIGALHDELGIELDLAAFYQEPTVSGIIAALEAEGEVPLPEAHHVTGRTVIPLRRAGSGRLWCFMPPLSGAVTRYASMPRLLPAGDAIWACETPAALSGRGMEAVTTGLADTLANRDLSTFGSVCLSGYSLGGVFALEVCRHLRARLGPTGPPVDVLMLDPPPPSKRLSSFDDTLRIFVNVGWRIDREPGSFVGTGGEIDFEGMAQAARDAGSLPRTGSAQTLADAWLVYDANARVLEHYTPSPLRGRGAAFLRCSGVEDAPVPQDYSPTVVPGDWNVVSDPARSSIVETEHFRLMEPPTDALVARWLTAQAAA